MNDATAVLLCGCVVIALIIIRFVEDKKRIDAHHRKCPTFTDVMERFYKESGRFEVLPISDKGIIQTGRMP